MLFAAVVNKLILIQSPLSQNCCIHKPYCSTRGTGEMELGAYATIASSTC